jgi:hypothetical protein
VHLVSLYPPAGGGRIRYHERLPLARASVILGRILADDDSFRTTAVGSSRAFITREGEHGLFIPLRGVRDHSRVSRSLAIVHTDETAAALDTLILVPERAAELELKTRELMVEVSFGLGTRRRRFFYEPPPGWYAIPGGLRATWHPPGYPRDACSLLVHPATPQRDFTWTDTETPAFREELVAGLSGPSPIESAPVTIPLFEGRRFSFTGKLPSGTTILREAVLLFRSPYVHAFWLDAADVARRAELSALLLRVVASSQPVPEPAARLVAAESGASLDHWVD